LHERALAIQDKGLDPELSEMNIRVNLAILKSKQGKFAEGQKLFEEALEMTRKSLEGGDAT